MLKKIQSIIRFVSRISFVSTAPYLMRLEGSTLRKPAE